MSSADVPVFFIADLTRVSGRLAGWRYLEASGWTLLRGVVPDLAVHLRP